MKFINYSLVAFFLTSWASVDGLYVENHTDFRLLVVAQPGDKFHANKTSHIYYINTKQIKKIATQDDLEYYLSIIEEHPTAVQAKPRYQPRTALQKKFEEDDLITCKRTKITVGKITMEKIKRKAMVCKILALKF